MPDQSDLYQHSFLRHCQYKIIGTRIPQNEMCHLYKQLPVCTLSQNRAKTVFTVKYPISLLIRQSFFLPKQSQRSRSVLSDRSRSLGLFRKGKTYYCLKDSPSKIRPGRVAQSVGHLTHKSGVLGSIPGLATYFRFSFRFFKKGSCQLLAKVCA